MSVRFYLAVGGGLAVIDRIVKILAISFQDPEGFFVNNFFGIKLFENSQAIFGLPKVSPFFEIIIAIVGIILISAAVSARKRKDEFLFFGLILIILGGFSNFLDRLIYGFVVDMIHFGPSVWNLADGMIAVGFAMAAVRILRKA